MLKGFQTLTDKQKVKAAHLAAKAGHDFFIASHIWYMDGEYPAVVLRFKTGVDALIQPTYCDS
jgi:hypothetical protein